MTTRDEIVKQVQEALQDLFNADPETLVPSAHLIDDLGLDSIDAIDLAVKLQQATGKKLRPEQFKAIETVDDMVNAVEKLLSE